MFISRKARRKILLLTVSYILLGVICYVASVLLVPVVDGFDPLRLLGGICLFLGFFSGLCGRYTEGMGNLINRGNRLIFQELRPAEFIRLYEQRRDDPSNVIAKPDPTVLQFLATAYDSLGDSDNALRALEQMRTAAPPRKNAYIQLLQASLLFSVGHTEEATALYDSALETKLDWMGQALADTVMKGDRALALGDYSTAEAYFRQALVRQFPKNTPLGILIARFALAKICLATGRCEEAREHLRYCTANGGETNIPAQALAMLEKLPDTRVS